jgi:hypothetical protein
MKLVEGMAAALNALGEQAALLRQELVTVAAAKDDEKTGTGPG